MYLNPLLQFKYLNTENNYEYRNIKHSSQILNFNL